MHTAEEKGHFLERGYLCVENIFSGEELRRMQDLFDHVWKREGERHVHAYELLKYRPYVEVIEHPPILDRINGIFGRQTQLLDLDLKAQPPGSGVPDYFWHRDMTFPGDYPLAINVLVFLDDIGPKEGPTHVLPGTHRGPALPPRDRVSAPMDGEVALPLNAGDGIFLNAAIWHTAGRNRGESRRRCLLLFYGQWWMKQYHFDRQIPWQALDGASEQRLRLLGIKMPAADLLYHPSPI